LNVNIFGEKTFIFCPLGRKYQLSCSRDDYV